MGLVDDVCTVSLSGNLTRDAELKYTNNGFAITALSIAVNRSRKVGEEWQQQGHFFDATILGKRGEGLAQYLRKGTKVFISGKLEQQRWQNQEGQNRSKVAIIIDDIILASRDQKPEPQKSGSYPDNDVVLVPWDTHDPPLPESFSDGMPF